MSFATVRKALKGLFDSAGATRDDVEQLCEREVFYSKEAADAMASTATASVYFYRVPRDGYVVSAYFVPRAAATANGSNFGTVILNKADGAGGADTAVGSVDTSTVSMANGVPRPLALTAANVLVTAGQALSLQITKAASGVVIPAGELQVLLRDQ